MESSSLPQYQSFSQGAHFCRLERGKQLLPQPSHTRHRRIPTGSLIMFTVLQERVQFDMQLYLKEWRCSANDVLMPETLHLSLRDTHQRK